MGEQDVIVLVRALSIYLSVHQTAGFLLRSGARRHGARCAPPGAALRSACHTHVRDACHAPTACHPHAATRRHNGTSRLPASNRFEIAACGNVAVESENSHSLHLLSFARLAQHEKGVVWSQHGRRSMV